MEHFVKEIVKTKQFSDHLPEILEKGPFKISYLIDKLKIPRTTFYNKLKAKTFTIDELLRIVSFVEPQEYQLTLLDESLKNAFEDLKNNRVKSHEDVMRDLRSKINSTNI